MVTEELVLEVIRGRSRVVARGTIEEIVRLGQAGKLKPFDRARGLPGYLEVAIHQIAELAPIVPTPAEYFALRSLRRLVIFDFFVVLPMILFLVGSVFSPSRTGRGSTSFVLLVALVMGLMFVAPVFPLWKRVRRLRSLRQQGVLVDPALQVAPGDRSLGRLLARRPIATWGLIALLIAVHLSSSFLPEDWLLDRFAKVNDAIRAGEWWRLFTPTFLHGGLLHIAFNVIALVQFGRAVENLFGRWKFLVLFFGTATAGWIASFLVTASPSVGASGGIFGLIGAVGVFGFRYRASLPPLARRQFTVGIALVVAINLALGFSVSLIDNGAHVGGLLAGIAMGLVLAPSREVMEVLA